MHVDILNSLAVFKRIFMDISFFWCQTMWGLGCWFPCLLWIFIRHQLFNEPLVPWVSVCQHSDLPCFVIAADIICEWPLTCESGSSHFQLGQGPNSGLLREDQPSFYALADTRRHRGLGAASLFAVRLTRWDIGIRIRHQIVAKVKLSANKRDM